MSNNVWNTMEVMVKGIFLGGSLGAIVGWTDIIPLPKALGLGMLCGCLASLTLRDRLDSRRKKNDNQDEQ
ncbi:MAG: hypothetical protein PHX58_06240 [Desulfovibrio sp.]|jgi:hypothetical protein|nr:hypothetical protein [Desulfovibrio sp.]